MNPYADMNSEPNFWLSCILISKDAIYKQICSENEAMYISKEDKTCTTEILETLAKYNAKGHFIWKLMHMRPIYHMNDFVTANVADSPMPTLTAKTLLISAQTFFIEDFAFQAITR